MSTSDELVRDALELIRVADLDAQRMNDVLYDLQCAFQSDGSVLIEWDRLRDIKLTWESSATRARAALVVIRRQLQKAEQAEAERDAANAAAQSDREASMRWQARAEQAETERDALRAERDKNWEIWDACKQLNRNLFERAGKAEAQVEALQLVVQVSRLLAASVVPDATSDYFLRVPADTVQRLNQALAAWGRR